MEEENEEEKVGRHDLNSEVVASQASQVALMGKHPLASAGDTRIKGSVPGGEIHWRRAWQPTPIFMPGESLWTEEPGGLRSTGSLRAGHGK